MQICSRLPKNEDEIEKMIQTGYDLARNMNWDVVVKNYLLKGLQSGHDGAEKVKVPDELHIS